ncbi:amyloid-beta A4 precursor protein-binding family A member 3 isoform X1 [Halyomorpha halys]|uniref:amyloid-beta A4 precursor protein-binding family A member 3 isoform X5 n=1 Tax=Halyomorpha halys TaxID=286706 RepID=UPI0006D4D116|nr:protein lin-10 isoform X3 [Halyomorpha halys]
MASLVEVDNLSNTEHITKLFPKCRPRDINLNSVPDNEAFMMETKQRHNRDCEEGESAREESSTEESNGEEPGQESKVVLQLSATKPASYKLRDSRKIEIAGGREVFSQSRCKAIRKSRSDDKMITRKQKSSHESGAIWELRNKNSECKKKAPCREVTETIFSAEVHSLRHQKSLQPKNGGGAVVFDDIEDSWASEAVSDGSPSPSRNCHPGPPAHYFKVATSVSDGESLSPEYDVNEKAQRVIGGLPIADYEGSPRRYGPKQPPSAVTLLSSPSFYTPRPGFPQRIVSEGELISQSGSQSPSRSTSPHNTELAAQHPQFDYMYEFSETRKVLEEFFKSGDKTSHFQVLLMKRQISEIEREINERNIKPSQNSSSVTFTEEEKLPTPHPLSPDIDLHALDPLNGSTPPPPAPQSPTTMVGLGDPTVEAALKDIRLTLQRTKTLPLHSPTQEPSPPTVETSPIWIPRRRCTAPGVIQSGDEDEADTDLETDRLLGQQRTDDQTLIDDKIAWRKNKKRNGKNSPSPSQSQDSSNEIVPKSPEISAVEDGSQNLKIINKKDKEGSKKKGRNKEVMIHEPAVLIEGVLFRARYLGSTQLVCEGQPTKSTRMMQAEEAVSRIKAPEGETQPSTEVDLFISTEKIMVLNTDLKEIMMDHALRTISYIADIGDLVVLMARRRYIPHEVDEQPKINRTPKMICHVFESEEAQFIAQSIGQAFQVAYMEFLKANGIEDHSFVKEMDYQEVLNSQEIFGDELQMFAKKEMQKEVVVPKAKGEILGVVIVESGWGSMLPTVVIANLAPAGAAARCGQLNIGDQIIAINGVSLVGLPLSTCQNYIKNSKTQTVVKLTVVPCAPVVEVKIKRPDTKYQLGFSVQNGVICSLLRGGIAERGGVRVGHRIIEINNQSVVAVPHEKIVNLLATSVGEILMKTMPTSMFRLLTGQETPVYI